jgi:P27 family predicted phage terminase small subunit
MGRRGPRPEPTALKILKGNPGKRSLNLNEPEPPNVKDLKPPEWLDKRAKEEWYRLVPILSDMGLFTELDVFCLSRYCSTVSLWNQVAEMSQNSELIYEVKKENKMGETYTSHYRERPELSIMLKLSSDLLKYEKEFGMTPAARSGLNVDFTKRRVDGVPRSLYGDYDPFAPKPRGH